MYVETFSGITNLAQYALVGSVEEAAADNAIHGVPWKSRQWKERLESSWRASTAALLKNLYRTRRGTGRSSWRFVDAGQRSGSSSRCLPSACYCLFKWPIRSASVTGVGATSRERSREIVGKERWKKKFLRRVETRRMSCGWEKMCRAVLRV